VLPGTTRTDFFEVQRTNDGHVSAPTGPRQDPDAVARAIVRSVRKPTPEVNMVRMFRVAYGLHGFFPALRDIAGRQFYRRTRGKPRRK
jgi:short-subunit dehydrogenase